MSISRPLTNALNLTRISQQLGKHLGQLKFERKQRKNPVNLFELHKHFALVCIICMEKQFAYSIAVSSKFMHFLHFPLILHQELAPWISA